MPWGVRRLCTDWNYHRFAFCPGVFGCFALADEVVQ
jgi:hypothetical protein